MFDLIIRGASIIDGTGRAAYTGDAAVSDGRIAAVGELGAAEAARVIEARGRCLTPGFIDIHRHADGEDDGADHNVQDTCISHGLINSLHAPHSYFAPYCS